MPSSTDKPWELVPLGDQAVLVYAPDETAALRFAALVRQANEPWLIDVVQAYTSVAVFFDLGKIGFRDAAKRLRAHLEDGNRCQTLPEGHRHRIPCCYEF